MLAAMFPLTGGFLLIKFAQNFAMLLTGRILTGVGVGLVSNIPYSFKGGRGSRAFQPCQHGAKSRFNAPNQPNLPLL